MSGTEIIRGNIGAAGCSRRRAAVWALPIAGAVFAAYSNVFRAPFLRDDIPSIVNNPTIRRPWRPDEVLTPPSGTTVEGRPILNASLALCYAIGGLDVLPYRIFNVSVHALAAVVLFGLSRRTLETDRLRPTFGADSIPISAAAAALWALHPLHTSCVTYIIQRAESLAGLFYLTAIYCVARAAAGPPGREERIACSAPSYRNGRDADTGGEDASATGRGVGNGSGAGSAEPSGAETRRGASRLWGAAAVASCWLGAGTKEIAATVPLMALLYDMVFFSGSFGAALRRRPAMYAGLAASWALIAFELAMNGFHSSTIGPAYGIVSLPEHLMTQSRAIAWYLRLAVWPSPLVFDYGPWGAGAPAVLTFAEWFPWGASLLVLSAATVWALRTAPAAGFAGVWFFATLSPSSLLPIPTEVMAEYRTYLPLSALCVLAAAGIWRAAARVDRLAAQRLRITARRSGPPDSISFAGSVSLPGAEPAGPPATVSMVRSAPDGLSARPSATEQPPTPACAGSGHREAAAFAAWSMLAAAVAALGSATYARNADYESALAIWGDTARKRPMNPRAHTDLGVALAAAGRFAEAEAAHRQAIRLKPDMEEAWNNLGNALAAMGRREEAAECYMRIINDNPRNVAALANMGSALMELGRAAEAEQTYRRALNINPNHVPSLSGLATLMAMSGRAAEAAELYESIMRICPEDIAARVNTAIALVGSGRPAEALPHCAEAKRLDPRLPEAHFAEGIALEALGRRAEAAGRYREALNINPAFAAARERLARIEQPAR